MYVQDKPLHTHPLNVIIEIFRYFLYNTFKVTVETERFLCIVASPLYATFRVVAHPEVTVTFSIFPVLLYIIPLGKRNIFIHILCKYISSVWCFRRWDYAATGRQHQSRNFKDVPATGGSPAEARCEVAAKPLRRPLHAGAWVTLRRERPEGKIKKGRNVSSKPYISISSL
jgi:hypothetical protein